MMTSNFYRHILFTAETFLLTLLFFTLTTVLANATPDKQLPDLIEGLNAEDTKEICQTLELMGKTCDQSCVPVISDMLRHDEPEIIKSACHAAKAMANPRLAPALNDIISHHPLNDVRHEALKALIRIGRPEDYRSLINRMETAQDHIDELATQIIRILPESQVVEMAPKFALLSQHHHLTTSVVHAYRHHPILLFNAILDLIPSCTSPQMRHAYFRALSLIDSKGIDIPLQKRFILNDISEQDIQTVAIIQANRSTPDAIQWILSHAHQISHPVFIDLLSRLSNDAAEQVIDTIITTKNPYDIHFDKSNSGHSTLHDVILSRAGNKIHAQKLANVLLKQRNNRPAALRHISRNIHSNEAREFIIQQLGNTDIHISMSAMQIASESPEYYEELLRLVLSNTNDDNGGIIYLARWAMAILVNYHHDDIRPDLKQKSIQEARQCILNPRRLHAEPALWLLATFNESIPTISSKEFRSLRPDMKRAILYASFQTTKSTQHNLSLLQIALEDQDQSIVADALILLTEHVEIAAQIPSLNDILNQYILSDNPSLSINALFAAGMTQLTTLIPSIQRMMMSDNDLVRYNSIWALQKMHALPDDNILSMMYFQSSHPILKERLGFLSGIDKNTRESFPASELQTQMPIQKNRIIQILNPKTSYSRQFITIINDDQAILSLQTNLMGFTYIP